jgi:hypothetical protein
MKKTRNETLNCDKNVQQQAPIKLIKFFLPSYFNDLRKEILSFIASHFILQNNDHTKRTFNFNKIKE